MALPKLKDVLGSVAAASLVLAPIAAADAQQVSTRTVPVSQQVSVPLRDARDAGPNSVRFAAAQFTQTAPSIALLGVQRESWPRIRDAIQEAKANGYPVSLIVMGPTDASPALEIYAKGTLVTRPIDPNEITGPRLTTLIRDVHREMYPKALASRMSYEAPSQDR